MTKLASWQHSAVLSAMTKLASWQHTVFSVLLSILSGRASYGVYFVILNSDSYFASVNADMLTILCYIGRRYNGLPLYYILLNWAQSQTKFKASYNMFCCLCSLSVLDCVTYFMFLIILDLCHHMTSLGHNELIFQSALWFLEIPSEIS